jgi:hypothetical protein
LPDFFPAFFDRGINVDAGFDLYRSRELPSPSLWLPNLLFEHFVTDYVGRGLAAAQNCDRLTRLFYSIQYGCKIFTSLAEGKLP